MDPRVLFEMFVSLGDRAKMRDDFAMIWHAVVWTIWEVRSDNYFSDCSTNVKKIDDKSIFFIKNNFLVEQW